MTRSQRGQKQLKLEEEDDVNKMNVAFSTGQVSEEQHIVFYCNVDWADDKLHFVIDCSCTDS